MDNFDSLDSVYGGMGTLVVALCNDTQCPFTSATKGLLKIDTRRSDMDGLNWDDIHAATDSSFIVEDIATGLTHKCIDFIPHKEDNGNNLIMMVLD